MVVRWLVILPLVLSALQLPCGNERTVTTGWRDEMQASKNWHRLGIQNQATARFHNGQLNLALGKVPPDWPYQYQWSGMTRDFKVDISRFPVLMAKVSAIVGYAHMDLEALDADGKPFKSFRSTTLQSPGLSTFDLSAALDPAIYTLRLRLIVGGPNSGCNVDYDWVRFVGKDDAEFLHSHPDWTKVVTARNR